MLKSHERSNPTPHLHFAPRRGRVAFFTWLYGFLAVRVLPRAVHPFRPALPGAVHSPIIAPLFTTQYDCGLSPGGSSDFCQLQCASQRQFRPASAGTMSRRQIRTSARARFRPGKYQAPGSRGSPTESAAVPKPSNLRGAQGRGAGPIILRTGPGTKAARVVREGQAGGGIAEPGTYSRLHSLGAPWLV